MSLIQSCFYKTLMRVGDVVKEMDREFCSYGAVQELRDPYSKSGIWVHVCQRRCIGGHDDTNDLGGR